MALATGTILLGSCNDFLNENPDNRTQIDTPEKVRQVLVSAYPENSYFVMAEYMSDNVDEYQNPRTDVSLDEYYRWKDATQTTNDSPDRLWRTYYASIANANEALKAIDKLGGPKTELLALCKGEALLCRAYAHFMLANIFCMNYGMPNSNTDMGIYYMYDTDTRIGQVNPRGTVAEVYQKIAKDLEEGLPLVGDAHLKVPKFHFNKKAAYAFATRFYLFHEEWEKAVKYANECLGSSPQTLLRDWRSYQSMTRNIEAYTLKYVNTENKCNLLMQKAYTEAGLLFNNYSRGKKYAHGPYLDNNGTTGRSSTGPAPQKPTTSLGAYPIFSNTPTLWRALVTNLRLCPYSPPTRRCSTVQRPTSCLRNTTWRRPTSRRGCRTSSTRTWCLPPQALRHSINP